LILFIFAPIQALHPFQLPYPSIEHQVYLLQRRSYLHRKPSLEKLMCAFCYIITCTYEKTFIT
jgi:hypothetical protein